jgi:hypothetical protein
MKTEIEDAEKAVIMRRSRAKPERAPPVYVPPTPIQQNVMTTTAVALSPRWLLLTTDMQIVQ